MSTSVLIGAMEYSLYSMIVTRGRTITIRDETVQAGANPYPNPPVYSGLVVNGTNLSGASSVNLRATLANGQLNVGDTLALGTDPTVYAVTTAIQSASNGFAAVPISPNLSVQHNDGEACVPTFLADMTVQALVTSFPARLVNNTSIQATDIQIRFLSSPINFTPKTTQKVFVGSDQYSIIAVKPVQEQGVLYAWSCHLRR